MTIRREGSAIIRDPFNEASPGDYAAPEATVRAIQATLAGSGEKLYDIRYPGPLKDYAEVSQEIAGDHAVAILRHQTLEHCIEITSRAKPLGSVQNGDHFAGEILSTLARPTVQADERDQGELGKYGFLERREEGGFTVLKLVHTMTSHQMEVAVRAAGVPPRRAYDIALDMDEVWRKGGNVVYDERNRANSEK